jgi:hypothetical protein
MEKTPDGMRALARQILDAVDRDPSPPEGGARERAQSCRAAAQRLHDLPDVVPWDWVTVPWLEGVESTIEPVAATLDVYASREDHSVPFPLGWPEVTSMWAALTPFMPAVPGRSGEDLAEEVTRFRSSAEGVLESIRADADGVSKAVAEVKDRLDELETARQESVSLLQQDQAALQATITEQTTRLEAAIRDNQAQFSTAQESHREQFTAVVEDARAKLQTATDAIGAEAGARAEEATATARAHVDDLARLEEMATRSYDAITTASVAGFFQKEANDQGDAANKWRRFGVIVLVLFSLVAIGELLLGDASPSLKHTAARLPFALAVAALAGYALRE